MRVPATYRSQRLDIFMITTNSVNTRATKLREELGKLGHQLPQSVSQDVMAKVERYPHWTTQADGFDEQRLTAERYLDEIFEAEKELDHAKFVRRSEPEYSINYSEKDFKNSVREIREELGSVVTREYWGCLTGPIVSDVADRYPGLVRHIWLAVFEKAQLYITLGVYQKNGTYYISSVELRED